MDFAGLTILASCSFCARSDAPNFAVFANAVAHFILKLARNARYARRSSIGFLSFAYLTIRARGRCVCFGGVFSDLAVVAQSLGFAHLVLAGNARQAKRRTVLVLLVANRAHFAALLSGVFDPLSLRAFFAYRITTAALPRDSSRRAIAATKGSAAARKAPHCTFLAVFFGAVKFFVRHVVLEKLSF